MKIVKSTKFEVILTKSCLCLVTFSLLRIWVSLLSHTFGRRRVVMLLC